MNKQGENAKQPSLAIALFAVATLLVVVMYGLIYRPHFTEHAAFPLEIVFLSAAVMLIAGLLVMGYDWQDILQAITHKLARAIPTLLLLFAIGLLISSWMMSGTIPMLVYLGLSWINIDYLYVVAFVLPIIFSLCTGTSWGSIATIGLVVMAVATVVNAHLAITAGAIVGGAYFGDKLSPLSDTTNIAAMAVGVDLYQHIGAMLYTTLPSALLSFAIFYWLGGVYPADIAFSGNGVSTSLSTNSEALNVDILQYTLDAISQLFTLHWLLLAPPAIILFGAFFKKPPLPTLIVSTVVACCLAFGIQSLALDDVIQSLYQGFNVTMTRHVDVTVDEHVTVLFNRGGLYALHQPVVITILVFIYVGALDCVKAIPTIINRLLDNVQRPATLISSSLIASAATNAMTSSQYANSFIVGETFAKKYDQLGVPRKVLSRSLEDTGTMIESLVPWSTTAVFIYATLGISVAEYWQWQWLSLINIVLAFMFAWLGIGQFQNARSKKESSRFISAGKST